MTLPEDSSSDRWPNDGETLTGKIRRGLTAEERAELRAMLNLDVLRELVPPGLVVEEPEKPQRPRSPGSA